MKNRDDMAGRYVKVSMDGAPYLRKVDLKNYKGYKELREALENLFGCFSLGIYMYIMLDFFIYVISYLFHLFDELIIFILMKYLGEQLRMDGKYTLDYTIAYEDKDLDLMLLGDVPWEYVLNLHIYIFQLCVYIYISFAINDLIFQQIIDSVLSKIYF